MMTKPPVWPALKPLVIFGWTVAALRLVFEFVAATRPDLQPYTMYFGIVYVMPVALLVAAWRKTFAEFTFGRLALAMWVLALLTWGLPNAISYTVGQFQEWTFGRFHGIGHNAHTLPVADTVLSKLGTGIGVGLMTHIMGTVGCLVLATVLIWLPKRLMRRKL
ncbi:MAG: hypothetical protein EXS14_10810 [Planctomycetes bacterium]|nr:hypothetical protein [Planctomycetota bacterium]